MTRLLTKLALGFSLAAGLIATTSTASAETESLMTVTVPFAFTANHVFLAAGTYSVRSSERYVRFTNTSTNVTSVVVIRRDGATANPGPSRLTFHRVNGQTYLSQVWTEGTALHSELLSHPKINREIGQVSLPDAAFEIATK